ncbi:hypothetical protein SMG44B_50221 [Stenotrophomonas maltophilia]
MTPFQFCVLTEFLSFGQNFIHNSSTFD